MPQYFVRFPSETMRPLAMPMLSADPERYRPFESASQDQILIADLSDDQRHAAEQNGAKVYEDVQFYPTRGTRSSSPGQDLAYWERAVASPSALAADGPSGRHLADEDDDRRHGPHQRPQGVGEKSPRAKG